jgi:ATP-dependent DNA ligase
MPSSPALPGIREALLSLPCKSAIIDAEVVARREDGSPDFRVLHSGSYSQEDLCFWCFDLLELNGEDRRSLPVIARKQSSRRSCADTIIFKNAEQLLVQMQAARPRRHRLEE